MLNGKEGSDFKRLYDLVSTRNPEKMSVESWRTWESQQSKGSIFFVHVCVCAQWWHHFTGISRYSNFTGFPSHLEQQLCQKMCSWLGFYSSPFSIFQNQKHMRNIIRNRSDGVVVCLNIIYNCQHLQITSLMSVTSKDHFVS